MFELITDEYAGIDVGRRSAPTFLDVDDDGDQDLIVARESEGPLLFRNEGHASEPFFEEGTPLAHPMPPLAMPAFGDPDLDGSIEWIVGEVGGGLVYYDDPGKDADR